ncbi:MAG: universal stress protein [Nitrosopumilaceae archaeon]|nr:universal stress protein [Nitrosopumilaceae archaeon]NIU00909.1 universal stress protein [Nitrosopumilaceae archaeon]NIU87362.1 universal stress protein [Nitrosopumilaceae archaeon]NIV65890.1 universal stress protein [Nitrosopumilaceae archaeon]NIX61511.1 universal stress protein [Nitrosopumilaceae archaeon]
MARQNIRKILVPLDGSKNSMRGLDEAISIAKKCNASITGLHTIPIYPRNLADAIMPYQIHMKKEAEDFMIKAKKRAGRDGIRLTKKIIYGSPINEITDLAKNKNFDMIVIGSRGHTGMKEVFLGSVANGVVHRSKVPVLVVK